jgi:hypothetical protein
LCGFDDRDATGAEVARHDHNEAFVEASGDDQI